MQTTRSLIPSLFAKPRGSTGPIKNEKAQLGTCDGVADAGHRLDGALTVAHAVWHFAGVA